MGRFYELEDIFGIFVCTDFFWIFFSLFFFGWLVGSLSEELLLHNKQSAFGSCKLPHLVFQQSVQRRETKVSFSPCHHAWPTAATYFEDRVMVLIMLQSTKKRRKSGVLQLALIPSSGCELLWPVGMVWWFPWGLWNWPP